jgi:opacity protein-like surface antigen
MRKFMGIIALVAAAALPVRAQKTPEVEIMGGYSYLRADMGGADLGIHGWRTSLTHNTHSWLGGTADISGYYTQVTPASGPPDVNVNCYLFLFGPQFSYRKNPSFTPFTHVLLGAMRASQGYLGISQSKTDFAAAFGGGVDFKIHKHVALRVVQADYIYTSYLNQRQNNLRLSAGIVLRFGEK